MYLYGATAGASWVTAKESALLRNEGWTEVSETSGDRFTTAD